MPSLDFIVLKAQGGKVKTKNDFIPHRLHGTESKTQEQLTDLYTNNSCPNL